MPRIIDKVAWIRLEAGRILMARSHGKDAYYLPGGKREVGESDQDTLVRELREELTVAIDRETAAHLGTFEAPAHGYSDGTHVRLACYAADYGGRIAPSREIAEVAWFTYADRGRVQAVNKLVFDHLRAMGNLRV